MDGKYKSNELKRRGGGKETMDGKYKSNGLKRRGGVNSSNIGTSCTHAPHSSFPHVHCLVRFTEFCIMGRFTIGGLTCSLPALLGYIASLNFA